MLIINCKEAANICDKAQYNEAKSLEKLQLRLHILYCGICRSHSRKNAELTKLCSKAKLEVMNKESKDRLKKEIDTYSKIEQQQ
ncbi:hypothetical protein [Robertkochia aurantiaca]|uniref:hypothetical protein n=1 Tax=Robertkochia aurantiaca TaxID=2873700 RepID=UPI001CCD3169|nr:hypothetical protein [Robertkochia sp. 3YJGBD-33]